MERILAVDSLQDSTSHKTQKEVLNFKPAHYRAMHNSGNSRLREMLLGGATRHILKNASARPVLLAH